MALVLALVVLAGCSITPPYQSLRGQSEEQLRIDNKECWNQAPLTAGAVIGVLLIGAGAANHGERVNAQRTCMRERGYCSTQTYQEGYWTRDAKDNFTWHEPVSAPGGFCKTEG
jgi:hypothetical protein